MLAQHPKLKIKALWQQFIRVKASPPRLGMYASLDVVDSKSAVLADIHLLALCSTYIYSTYSREFFGFRFSVFGFVQL